MNLDQCLLIDEAEVKLVGKDVRFDLVDKESGHLFVYVFFFGGCSVNLVVVVAVIDAVLSTGGCSDWLSESPRLHALFTGDSLIRLNERGSNPRPDTLFSGSCLIQLRECGSSPRLDALFTGGCSAQPRECGSSPRLNALFTGRCFILLNERSSSPRLDAFFTGRGLAWLRECGSTLQEVLDAAE
jgi:hypothetical protein